MTPLLELIRVTKSFGAVQALRGVSFELRAREVHALLGENGAGKTTLIKVITGAHEADSGTITVGGQTADSLTPADALKIGIACVYQQPLLFPDLTVMENMALRLEPTGFWRRVSWPERRRRAQQLLSQVGAQFSPQLESRRLSMPEQQLLEIACAIGAGARILILDEPTASLTEREQELLFRVVRELRRNGTGIIYISHRLEEIFTLADRVTVLRDGQSVGTHTVRDVDETALIRLMVGRDLALENPASEASAGEVVLTLKNLGCAAGGVHDVSLEIRAGEVVGMAGLIGSGRTELARTLFGLTPADAGEIRLTGRRVWIGSPREAMAHGLAYVPEDRRRHGIILELPLAANITLAIHRRLFPGGWLRRARERTCAQGFLRDLRVVARGPEAPGHSLSGGNQQKVALARWLATQPKVLILDEPTQGVDIGAKAEIHQIIRRLAQTGVAILLISSELAEVLALSHRIAVMRGGTIVAILPGRISAHEVMACALGQSAQAA